MANEIGSGNVIKNGMGVLMGVLWYVSREIIEHVWQVLQFGQNTNILAC